MKKSKIKKILATSAMGVMALAMPFALTGCDKDSDINVRVEGEYVQWQVDGEDSWTNLLTIDEIKDLLGDTYKGDKGDPGINGRDVEFRVDSGYIQWSYVGEGLWKNLLEISSINSNNNETIKSINVCYHMNGGNNPAENTIIKELTDSNEIKLVLPTKDGYSFVNWYLDEECTKVFDGGVCLKDLEEDNTLCLYAKWTNDYTVEGTKFVSLNNVDVESFVVPDYVTHILYDAFEKCPNLKELTIPRSVKYMGWGSIFGFSNIEEPIKIYYNGTVKEWAQLSIGSSAEAFYRPVELYCSGCSVKRIQEKDLEGVTHIRNFSNIINLEEVDFPDSVYNIDSYAFFDCINLKRVYIPNSVTSIDMYAFSRCTSLDYITIPSSVTNIRSQAFASCDNLKTVRIESEAIANSLVDDEQFAGNDQIPLIKYATVVYIKTGLNTTNSTYLNENFTKQETSGADGYDQWVRN